METFSVEPWKIWPWRYKPYCDILIEFPQLTLVELDDIINYIYHNYEEVKQQYDSEI